MDYARNVNMFEELLMYTSYIKDDRLKICKKNERQSNKYSYCLA